MNILGIDPGSRKVGFALISSNTSREKDLTIEHLETFKVHLVDSFIERLFLISTHLKELIQQFRPDHVVIEGLIFVKSPTALIKLAQVRGALIATLGEAYLHRIFEYSPNLIKQTVTGFGHADKEAVQKMIKLRYPQFAHLTFETDDASDALLIALCHHIHQGREAFNPQLISLPKPSTTTATTTTTANKRSSKSQSKGLAGSLAHLLKKNNEVPC